MIRLRILLLPIMVIFEVALMLLCVALAFIAPRTAIRINEWSKNLPDLEWYFKHDRNTE